MSGIGGVYINRIAVQRENFFVVWELGGTRRVFVKLDAMSPQTGRAPADEVALCLFGLGAFGTKEK